MQDIPRADVFSVQSKNFHTHGASAQDTHGAGVFSESRVEVEVEVGRGSPRCLIVSDFGNWDC